MHRIIRKDGKIDQSEFIRWSATLAYSLFVVSGVLFLLSPVLRSSYGKDGIVMAAFLVIGGGLCAAGSVTRRWVGEFIGAPLLAVAFASLGFINWLYTHDTAEWIAYGNLTLMLALATLMVIRWRMVLAVQRFVHAIAIAEKGDDE